jgi:hypothetical protein
VSHKDALKHCDEFNHVLHQFLLKCDSSDDLLIMTTSVSNSFTHGKHQLSTKPEQSVFVSQLSAARFRG